MKQKIILPFFIIIVSLSLCGCFFQQNRLLTLFTNIPEFTAYIEYFNASQNRLKVELQYSDAPLLSLQDKNRNPDLFIYSNLATPQFLPYFSPLDKLLGPEKISRESFYSGSLEAGILKEKQLLLPLCFSLPMITFKKDNLDDDILSLIIDLETVKEKSLAFYPEDSRKYGFSPFWNDEFLLTIASAMGVNFTTSSSRRLSWNSEAMDNTITFLNQWQEQLPGGQEKAAEFTERYMNIPAYKLLYQDKILFYYSDSRYLYTIPIEIRKNLDFRWLTYNNKIPVTDSIIYIGIPENSKKKRGAGEFIQWLLNPQVQSGLLETNSYKRLSGIFGIANHFSSIIEVNEKYIPQNHPIMVSHIPEPDYLLFPGQLPGRWPEIRKIILKEWLPAVINEADINLNLENLLNF